MMSEGKTIGQLMEEMRAKAGAQNYHGHGYMDLQRFAEDTRHMIIFDVLTNDSPVGCQKAFIRTDQRRKKRGDRLRRTVDR